MYGRIADKNFKEAEELAVRAHDLLEAGKAVLDRAMLVAKAAGRTAPAAVEQDLAEDEIAF